MQSGVSDQRLGHWNFAFVTEAAVASGFGPRAESPEQGAGRGRHSAAIVGRARELGPPGLGAGF